MFVDDSRGNIGDCEESLNFYHRSYKHVHDVLTCTVLHYDYIRLTTSRLSLYTSICLFYLHDNLLIV